MTPWEVALEILKFVALGVSAASGWYATLHETKDKDTGKLTKAGRVVFRCLIFSSIIAIAAQSLDSKNTLDKIAKEQREKAAAVELEQTKQRAAELVRTQQFSRLQEILNTAQDASSNSQRAAQQSNAAVARLHTVTDVQRRSLEATWRLQRPFGNWQAQTLIWGIPLDEETNVRHWVDRVVERAKEPGTLEKSIGSDRFGTMTIRETDPLFPNWSKDYYRFPFLDDVPVVFKVNPRVKPTPFRFTQADLILSLHPRAVSLLVQVDTSRWVINNLDAETTYEVDQQEASTVLSRWVDMYGCEMIVFPTGLLQGAKTFTLFLGYKNTIDPRQLVHAWSKTNREEYRDGDKSLFSFAQVLTEKELGPFPFDYKQLFPNEFRQLNQRMQARGVAQIEQ